MARPVLDAQVRAVIPGTTIADLAVPFISCANGMVDRLAASPCGSDLTDAELECIEIYVSAHLAAQTDPSLAIISERVEGSSVTASRGNVSSHSGIMATNFGQMANTISNGCLQEFEKREPGIVFA